MARSTSNARDPKQLIPFAEVPDRLPRRGKRKIHLATIHRWAVNGVRGLRLRYVQVGQMRCTSEEWLNDFFARLAGGENAAANQSEVRKADHEDAEDTLASVGI